MRVSDGLLNEGVSRRNFLAGVGVGALGLATVGLTACGGQPSKSEGAQDADADASEAAGAGSSTPGETVEADVCVIGSGPSGLSAAIAAAEAGASVVVVEALDDIGVCGHSITAVGTPWQQDLGITMTAENLVDFWAAFDDPHQDRDLMLMVAGESANTISWLGKQGVEFVGVTVPPTNPFQDPMCTMVTKGGRDGKASYLTPLKAKADELGVSFRFGATATGLVRDDSGAISGVTADVKGGSISVNAKATVLASGGFGSDAELVRLFAPRTPNSGDLTGVSHGFALRQAPRIGAQIAMPGGTQALFSNPNQAGNDLAGMGMFVTLDGKRFVNENRYTFDRSAIAFEQGISRYWAIYDEPGSYALYNMSKDNFAKGIEAGTVTKADTVAELAAAIGMNAAALEQTVASYNAACESGVDAEFGKPAKRTGRVSDPNKANEYDPDVIEREFTLLNPIATPPFYAVEMQASAAGVTGTQGGVKIDASTAVVGTSDEAIPGLFAAGEAANGQIFGYAYPQSGASLCMCFTLGRIAGDSAAAYAVANA